MTFTRYDAINLMGDAGLEIFRTVQVNKRINAVKQKTVLVPWKHHRTGTESTMYKYVNVYDIDECIEHYENKLDTAKNLNLINNVLIKLNRLRELLSKGE